MIAQNKELKKEIKQLEDKIEPDVEKILKYSERFKVLEK